MSRLRSPTLLSYSLRSQTVGLNKAHTETPRDLLAFVPRCKIGWGVAGLTPYEEWLVTEAWGPESLAPSENKQTKIRYGLWWHSYNLSAGEEGAKVFFLASQSSESVMSRFSERLWLKKKKTPVRWRIDVEDSGRCWHLAFEHNRVCALALTCVPPNNLSMCSMIFTFYCF